MKLKDIRDFRHIVVLTGAGISAESGLSTFRDSNGLWENYNLEDVATPEAFQVNPRLVWAFYSTRRRDAAKVSPNAAHLALAQYAKQTTAKFTLITQNVDMLHERAQSPSVIAMHGRLFYSHCTHCERLYQDITSWSTVLNQSIIEETTPLEITPPLPAISDLQLTSDPSTHADSLITNQVKRDSQGLPLSPCCQKPLRPHIVWFGEMPMHIDLIEAKLESCDLFVTIGTSGQVYPAAGFLAVAKSLGATTLCLNKERIPQHAMIDYFVEGPATETVPRIFTDHGGF